MPFNSVFSHIIKKRIPRINRFSEDPISCQKENLKFLLTTAAYTTFGKQYDYNHIHSVKSFQAKVPLSNYDSLKPYIERQLLGEVNVLWPGKTSWFAKSSGTSSNKEKLLPITVDSLYENHYAGGKDLLALYYQNFPNRKLYNAKHLIIGGSTQIQSMSNDTSIGDLSAFIVENLPWWTEIRRTPKREIALMNNWEEKLDKMAYATINENICIIAGLPSWTSILMKKILTITGKTNIHEVWPNLELYIHGGMNFSPYEKTFNTLFPDPKMNYVEAYNSSEGYFGLQDQVNSKNLLLLSDSHVFYEFIPMEDYDGLQSKTVLSLEEIELNKEYALVISTSAGLWRYIIGDTIKFVEDSPYRFQVTGRTTQFINAFGEKLLMIHAEKAIAKAANECKAAIKDYTVAPFYNEQKGNGGHEWAISFDRQPEDISEFQQQIDNELKQLNGDYFGKRAHDINMIAPKIRVVEPDVFDSWLKSKNKLGGQHKVPRLSEERSFIEEILDLSISLQSNSYI
ncbi:MAG: hypothetical protein DBW72_03115 [Flavobacteriales bacterium]|nr:MAG: hypothetical protein DBW72_03115 [Flavobacteriales bacterium]